MPNVCLYFQVHQPHRLVPYDFFSIGKHLPYEDDRLNAEILSKVAERCYLPTNDLFCRLIDETNGRFKFALSLSGTVIEQMERFWPDVLDSFRRLVVTGKVELLGETYYRSLAFLYSKPEFERQVVLHREAMERVFSMRPKIFCNTGLMYNNAVIAAADTMGFQGALGEGIEPPGDLPNHVYRVPGVAKAKILLRNAALSDDLNVRFSDKTWESWPLTPEKFASWVENSPGEIVNLVLDYETIGEHQERNTGIFEFWGKLPAILLDRDIPFVTPSEAVESIPALERYNSQFVSPAVGNTMQREAIEKIHRMERAVMRKKDPNLTHAWAKLQTLDHFNDMATSGTEGAARPDFNPYLSAHEAYIRFMNVLADFQLRLI